MKNAFKNSELTITRICCKAKAKDLTFKAKAKAEDTKNVLKDSKQPYTFPTEQQHTDIQHRI